MGFWGSLGKGLLKAAPFAAMAIPGMQGLGLLGGLGGAAGGAGAAAAGGIGSKILGGLGGLASSGILGNVAQMMGSGAEGDAKGRAAEAALALQRDQNRNQRYATEQGAATAKDRTEADLYGTDVSAGSVRDKAASDIYGADVGAASAKDRAMADIYGIGQQAATARDRALTDIWNIGGEQKLKAGDLDLRQRQFGLDATDQRAQQAIRGGLMANLQDVGLGAPKGINVTSFSGGLRPSAMGAGAREFGTIMGQQALDAQRAGGEKFDKIDFGAAPTLGDPLAAPTPGQTQIERPTFSALPTRPMLSSPVAPPEEMDMPEAGIYDKIAGPGSQVLSVLDEYLKKRKPKTTTPPPESMGDVGIGGENA